MEYNVIHLIEASDRQEEIEYSRLVEQCRQIVQFLAGNKDCREQVCMTFSDVVKEIPIEHGQWPGDTAFRRPRRKKKSEKNEQKTCFEEVLQSAAVHMNKDEEWIVILYTNGAIRRSKRTMLARWKKRLPVSPVLLAMKTDRADQSFLESYTDDEKVFVVGKTGDIQKWFDKSENLSEGEQKNPQEETEIWKIIRDCFE